MRNRVFKYIPVCLIFCVILTVACDRSSDVPTSRRQFNFSEYDKDGGLTLFIVGDYFRSAFITELGVIARRLTLTGTPVIICSERARTPLENFLKSNNVYNSRFVTFDSEAAILREWARDIVITGENQSGVVAVISPNKHATDKKQAFEFVEIVQEILGEEVPVVAAPFVFESGNLALVDTDNGKTVLVTGQKTILDNEIYQQQPWAGGLVGEKLLEAIETTFNADSVVILGQTQDRPPSSLFFEYHIDMSVAILRDRRAVVSQLSFDETHAKALARAVDAGHNIFTPFLDFGYSNDDLKTTLSNRLIQVKGEYESYASTLRELGMEIHRSPVTWMHVLSFMSWTNILQVGNTVFVPVYPDSIHGKITKGNERDGHVILYLDTSSLEEENFRMDGNNGINIALYENLGYEVVPVPEYLHYFMGGIHCFVNILE